MASKPDFILVPGAWHDPSAFQPTTTILEKAGYVVHGVSLPSVGASPHLKSFQPDVNAIRTVVDKVLSSGKNVVLVYHSYGGVVGAEALTDYVKELESGSKKQSAGEIHRLVYCCAFCLPAGASLMLALNNKPLPWFVIKENAVTCTDPQEIFYNDINPTISAKYIASLKEHSYPTFSSQLTCEPWKVIPSTYIVCEKDNAIPPPAQEGMVAQARVTAPNAFDVVEKIDASHSPFISQPEILAKLLIKAAGGA